MNSIDLDVLEQAQQWLTQGLQCHLVTVVKTLGSSPRPPGSMLVMCENGQLQGSISGGCVEDDLLQQLHQGAHFASTPKRMIYGVDAEAVQRFGLPCGGTIHVVVEPLSAQSQISELLHSLRLGQLVLRALDLNTGQVDLQIITLDDLAAMEFPEVHLNDTHFYNVHGPRWRLLIIGAGPMSAFLAEIAKALDYQVMVCDPREEMLASWNVAGVSISTEMPDDCVIEMQLDERSAVVALTHDPKLDDLALMEALKSPAFYVGAIGSRVNNARRRERLLEFDLSAEQIARLRGPIGLYIGSKTPAEIAISILAELTAMKNNVPLNSKVALPE